MPHASALPPLLVPEPAKSPLTPRVLVACPDARPPAYQAVVGLARAGMLDRFVTSFYDPGDGPIHAIGRRFAPAGFARIVYIGEGGAPPQHYREELIHLPEGRGVRAYARAVEDVYLVLRGVLTVGWEEGGASVEQRLGPKDLVFNPAGRAHYFRNDGLEPAQFMMVVGTPDPEDVRFQARG